MRLVVLIFVLLSPLAGPIPIRAADERAGEFDYYVLAMSWSPNWCALEGDAKGSEQCRKGAGFGWVLHGLWPQYDAQGWPSHCKTSQRPPSRGMTAKMADIMGTSGLAWYQWKKHGSCSGLSAADYYALSRQAFESVQKPEVFHKLKDPVKLPAHVVEEAFLKDNPALTPDMLTITCIDGYIQEARLCLSKDLEPIPCTGQTARDCTMTDALFEPVE